MFHAFKSITASGGQNWYIQEPQAECCKTEKLRTGNMERRKELAVGLAFCGDDKFPPMGESLSEINTSCPRLKSP